MLRKSFIAQDDIQQARLYVSAAAYYKMTLNGKSITSSHLNPGFTHYDKRNLYNTYDVTTAQRRERTICNTWERILQRIGPCSNMEL